MSNPTIIGTKPFLSQGKQLLFTITYDPAAKELECAWQKVVLDRVINNNYLFSVIVLIGQVLSELLHKEREIQIEKEKQKEASKLFIPNA